MFSYFKDFKVLYVDGNENDFGKIFNILEQYFKDIKCTQDSLEALSYFEEFKDSIDLVILDIDLDGISGLELAKMIRQQKQNMKIIVLSDKTDTEHFLEAISIKVDKFILKPVLSLALLEACDDLLKIEQEHKNIVYNNFLNKQYEDILDKVALVSKTDTNGKITYVNPLYCEISGYEEEDFLGNTHNIMRDPKVPKSYYEKLWSVISLGEIWNGQSINISKCGVNFWVQNMIYPIKDDKGKIIRYISIGFVINKYKMEEQKIQANLDKIKNDTKLLQKQVDHIDDQVKNKDKEIQDIERQIRQYDREIVTNKEYIKAMREFMEKDNTLTNDDAERKYKKHLLQAKSSEKKMKEKIENEQKVLTTLENKLDKVIAQYEEFDEVLRDRLEEED